MSRSVIQLKEIAELKDSLHQTPQYVDDGYPMVRVTDIRRGFLNLSGTKKVPLDTYLEFVKRYVPMVGDILFSRVGSYGNSCFVDRSEKFCLGQNTVCISPNRDRVDPFYLYCCINSPLIRGQVESFVGGASQPTISLKSIAALRVPVLSLTCQRQTASVLLCYDCLIENNTRRIEILEEMAQMIYREWFVNLRFPGHEKVEMVASEGGQIPSNWQSLTIGEVLQLHTGGGWGEDQSNGDYNIPGHVIRGTDIPNVRMGDFSRCPLRFHKESNIKSRRLQSGDIVFEVSGGSKGQPVGRALLIHSCGLTAFGGNVICASFCKLLRPDPSKIGRLHLYEYLLDSYTNGLIDKYQVQSTGITNFKFSAFLRDARIAVPPRTLATEFENISQPLIDEINFLGRKNAILRQTRDLLLPKLISGEIDVEYAELEAVQSA